MDADVAGANGEQRLYRLTYDGGDGRVTLRVVLRTAGGERFQIAASDLVGRRVSGLDYNGDRSVLVDYRRRTYCIAGSELRLPAVHPELLPLSALPRVLDGQLPVAPAPGQSATEFVDRGGRRWLASYDGDELTAWTLFDSDGPAVWWSAQKGGGILSQRGGAQYRWVLSVAEVTREPLAEIIPEEFAQGACPE